MSGTPSDYPVTASQVPSAEEFVALKSQLALQTAGNLPAQIKAGPNAPEEEA